MSKKKSGVAAAAKKAAKVGGKARPKFLCGTCGERDETKFYPYLTGRCKKCEVARSVAYHKARAKGGAK